MSPKPVQKTLSQFSLYLDKKLVSDFDKAIFPYKRSNVVHQLISEFLIKKNYPESTPYSQVSQERPSAKKGALMK